MTIPAQSYRAVSDFLEDDTIDPIRKGIGGSDIAAIVGLNPRSTKWDVWATITGRKERFKGNVATRTGNGLEPWVADVYRKKHNAQLIGPTAPYIEGHMRRSPDRLMLSDKAILEVKTSLGYGARNIWPDGDAAPEYVNAQVRWYMSKPYDLRKLSVYEDYDAIETYAILNGYEWVPEYADIATFMTGPEHRYYRIYHDPEIADTMLEEADKFWREHILKDIEPDPDGSDAAAEHISKRFKESTDLIKEPDHSIMPAIIALREKDPLRRQLEKECKALSVNIKKYIGEDRGLKGNFGKITWYTQSRSRFDKDICYQALMKHLPRAIIDEVFAAAKKTSEGRVFKATWKDTDDE